MESSLHLLLDYYRIMLPSGFYMGLLLYQTTYFVLWMRARTMLQGRAVQMSGIYSDVHIEHSSITDLLKPSLVDYFALPVETLSSLGPGEF